MPHDPQEQGPEVPFWAVVALLLNLVVLVAMLR